MKPQVNIFDDFADKIVNAARTGDGSPITAGSGSNYNTSGIDTPANLQTSSGTSIHKFMLGVDSLGSSAAFLAVQGKDIEL